MSPSPQTPVPPPDQFALILPPALLEHIVEQVAERLAQQERVVVEPWVGVAEAAAHLGCRLQRIYDLVCRRASTCIPHRKEGPGCFSRSPNWTAGSREAARRDCPRLSHGDPLTFGLFRPIPRRDPRWLAGPSSAPSPRTRDQGPPASTAAATFTSTPTASRAASAGGGPRAWTALAAPSDRRRPTPTAELLDVTRVRFGDYARDWIEHYQGRASRGFRESTRAAYRQMLAQRLIPYFDGARHLRLAEMQPRDVKAFVRWLVEQRDPRSGQLLAKSTVREHVAVLRALLGDAKEEDVLRDNPAAGVRIVPEGEGTGREPTLEKRALTIAELRVLLTALPAEWRLLFELLAHSGLRIGEAIELRWGRDLILQGRPCIKLRWQFADGKVCEPKTRYGKRDVLLSPGLTSKLLAPPPARSHGQLVFPSSVGTRLPPQPRT